jgi:hypothetical protein
MAQAAGLSPKIGPDDLLATVGPAYVLDLIEKHAIDPIAEGLVLSPGGHYYVMHDSQIFRKRANRDGLPVEQKLANFAAEITADVTEDDGVEQRRSYDVEGQTGKRKHRFHLPLDEFAKPSWPQKYLGAKAIVEPEMWSQVMPAIQYLSQPVEAVRYAHLGWRDIDGRMVYLHGGGAIGSTGRIGDIQVALPPWLARFEPELARNPQERSKAIGKLLGLLDCIAATYDYASAVGRDRARASRQISGFGGVPGRGQRCL